MRAAFNADKQALQDKVKILENSLKEKEGAQRDINRRMSLMEQNDSQQRSELNFWNGKVTNMKRDIDLT